MPGKGSGRMICVSTSEVERSSWVVPTTVTDAVHADGATPAGASVTDGSVVLESRDGRTFVRSATRTGTEPDREAPVAFLDTVGVPSSPEPVQVRLLERDGSRVLLRQLDPGDPEPERVPVYDGDELVVLEALSHIGLHTSADPEASDDFLFGYRIVPVREEPGRVQARTLRLGEPDTGQRVHVRPGDTVELVDVTVELEYLDSLEPATESGHVPLTPALWTWLNVGEHHDPTRTRYVLAAARRLDAANQLLITVNQQRQALDQAGLGGPQIRRHLFHLVGDVEMAVVALARAVDMVRQASKLIGCPVAVPAEVTSSWDALNALRNAYEHIEDRALGQVQKKPHPDALTIFDQARLLTDSVLVYGHHELNMITEIPGILAAVRRFLKDATANG